MLKDVREKKKMSRTELGKKVNVSNRTIEGYEHGLRDINKASVTTITKLALNLDCKIEDILTDKETIENLKKIYG